MKKILLLILLFFKGLVSVYPVTKTAGLTAGHSYDPSPGFDFLQLSLSRIYPYHYVWRHPCPENLFFKIESNLGMQTNRNNRVIGSVNMFALLESKKELFRNVSAYVEAGIGLIYTDFQYEHQDLRINFNPQLGFGLKNKNQEYPFFFAVRMHHISNGNLRSENRGINSITFQIGREY
jgi:lipid A 3-O-deacylase